MTTSPPLPPRNHSFEVRLEPTQPEIPDQPAELVSGVYFSLVKAKLFTNNPAITSVKCFLTCELHEESESSELSDGESLAPVWRKPFKTVVDKDDRSKLVLRLYEYYAPDLVICLGKVELHTYQISYFVGALRSFPLDPVSRTDVPADSLARFLLVLRSYLQIEFTEIKPETPPEVPFSPPLELKVPSNSILNTTAPPLPPRRSASLSPILSSNPPPLPPRTPVATVTIVTETQGKTGTPETSPPALLVSANNTPAPVPPKQPSLIGRIANYFAGGSSVTGSDTWYHRMIESEKNHFLQFESLYYAYETEGHSNRMSKHVSMGDYVYLYVPGLYSGKHPWSRKTGHPTPPPTPPSEPGMPAPPRITKHHQRVEFLKTLGLDARIVPVPNDGRVVANSHLIADAILEAYKETGKYVVLIGYSKGGVDSTAALSLNPELVKHVRCLITLFSPLYGSHIAADIDSSVLGSVVYMGIQKIMDCNAEAMKDLSFISRSNFLQEHPFDERVPALCLASAVTTAAKMSTFQAPYKYILSKYTKENDGLVACQDAILPGASMVLVPGMDHVGPRPEYPVYRNHVSFILAVIEAGLHNTEEKWNTLCHEEGQPTSLEVPLQKSASPKSSTPPPLPARRDSGAIVEPCPSPPSSTSPPASLDEAMLEAKEMKVDGIAGDLLHDEAHITEHHSSDHYDSDNEESNSHTVSSTLTSAVVAAESSSQQAGAPEKIPEAHLDFHSDQSPASPRQADLINFADLSRPMAPGNNPFTREDPPVFPAQETVDLPLPSSNPSTPP